jgi:PPP family 3-phenylpropionic acid transporter
MKLNFKVFLFVQYFSLGIWGPYLPVYLHDKQFSEWQIGLLLGTMPIVMMISQPVWSYLSDVLRTRRSLLVISCLSSAIAWIALGLANQFLYVFLWTSLFSALWTPVNPVSTAILLETLEETGEAETYSLVRLWGSIGFAVARFLIGWLFLEQISAYLAWFTGGTYFILGGLSLLLPEKRAPLAGQTLKGRQILAGNPRLVIYLIASIFIGATLGIYNNYQALFLQFLDAEAWLLGLTVSLQAIAEVPLMLLVPLALKRFSAQAIILAGAVLLPLRWALYFFIQRPEWVAPSQLIHGLAIVSFYVVGVSYIDHLISPDWRATGQGLYGTALYGIGSALGLYLAGLALAWFDIRSVWGLSFILGVIGLGLLLFAFRRKARDEENEVKTTGVHMQNIEG